MLKYFIMIPISALVIYSCASPREGRLGTGKPKFSSIEVDGISCFLSSENGYFRPDSDFKLIAKLKNTTSERKVFIVEKDRLFMLEAFSETGERIYSADISAVKYIGSDNLVLDPGSERVIEIAVPAADEAFSQSSSISCRIRLSFLPRQFRRNAVSVFLEKR